MNALRHGLRSAATTALRKLVAKTIEDLKARSDSSTDERVNPESGELQAIGKNSRE
jgi:hypothetical protein